MEKLFASRKTMILIIALLFLALFFLIYTLFFRNSVVTKVQPSPSPETVYNPDVLTQDYNRMTKPKPLSAQDESAKEKILSSIGNKSGTVKKTQGYNIEYVATAKSFMIFLQSTNPEQDKKDAEKWLTDQGLSTQGICNLPVDFVLGGAAMEQYRKDNKEFNPIPDGC
jgi:hypothetical protein